MAQNYAPFDLILDPKLLGLATTTVSSGLGTCVARHTPTRSSTRATLFLHGAAGSWTTWTPLLQAAQTAGLNIGDVVILDLPGWGDALLAAAPERQTIDSICELVKDMAEGLGYTEWDVVGHSLGGFVALHMAAIWPQAVLSVGTVSGTTWAVIASIRNPARGFFSLPGFIMLWRVMQFLAALGTTGTALVRGVSTLGLMRVAAAPLFRHPWRIPPRQGTALGDEIRPAAFVAATAVTRGYDAESLWGAIECPVRATKGDRDVFVTDSDLRHLERTVPGSVCTVISDCGHFGALEQPYAVLGALGFLGPTPQP